jgi:hypothetical protein
MATFNINNYNKNAPVWWTRLESALLIGLVPSFTGFITAIPMQDHEKVWALAGAGFFTGIIKTIGIFLGESDKENESNI